MLTVSTHLALSLVPAKRDTVEMASLAQVSIWTLIEMIRLIPTKWFTMDHYWHIDHILWPSSEDNETQLVDKKKCAIADFLLSTNQLYYIIIISTMSNIQPRMPLRDYWVDLLLVTRFVMLKHSNEWIFYSFRYWWMSAGVSLWPECWMYQLRWVLHLHLQWGVYGRWNDLHRSVLPCWITHVTYVLTLY